MVCGGPFTGALDTLHEGRAQWDYLSTFPMSLQPFGFKTKVAQNVLKD